MGIGRKPAGPPARGLILALLVGLAPAASAQGCREDRVEITGDFGKAQFRVEIADDVAERAQGLMNRESMPKSAGMLFVYEEPQRVSFWMRNTLIELDMIFADKTGRIRHIHHRAQPLDETPIPGGSDDVLAVLEINGGLAKRMGLDEGDILRHPAFAGGDEAANC